MSSARKRGPLREPGLVEWALTEPGVVCEVIADGAHVAPALLKMLVRCKGAAGISIISDATAACGYPEGQVFLLGGQECVVENGLCLTADRQTLAGSPVTMFESVHNMEQLADVPRVEAVRMASYNAAEALDLTAEVGSLTAGTNADFLLLDEQDQLLATYVSGTRIHPKFAI